MFNVGGQIGGDAELSSRGQQYSKMLPSLILDNVGDAPLQVWTSTLRRTIQTAQHLPYPKKTWKSLDELDAGVCDGMTYEEIEERYPEDYANRDEDKFNYRYRGAPPPPLDRSKALLVDAALTYPSPRDRRRRVVPRRRRSARARHHGARAPGKHPHHRPPGDHPLPVRGPPPRHPLWTPWALTLRIFFTPQLRVLPGLPAGPAALHQHPAPHAHQAHAQGVRLRRGAVRLPGLLPHIDLASGADGLLPALPQVLAPDRGG